MRTVLEIIFGFENEEKLGILGQVAAHNFIIEAQGKGTLHAHGLIWLTDGIVPRLFFILTNIYKRHNLSTVAGEAQRYRVQKSSYRVSRENSKTGF